MTIAETVKTKITDEMVIRLKEQVGRTWERKYEPWEIDGSRISRSLIRRWAVLIGDMRQIYLDLAYARNTTWGSIIAPPGMLLDQEQFDPEVQGLPGCQAILASAKLQWELPIKLGDLLVPTTILRAVHELPQPPGNGRVVAQEVETGVRNEDGNLIGTVLTVWNCYERGSPAQRALYGNRQDPHVYTHDDIEALKAEYKLEEARWHEPLYWEDVVPGQEIPYVLKGPTTHTKYAGKDISSWYLGHGQGWDVYEEHPELFFMNEHGAPEPIQAIDWTHYRASRWGGLPGAIEVNTERIHWVVHALMSWMGDDGRVRSLDLRFPKQNMLGDVTRCYGKVSSKRTKFGKYIVEVDVTNINQLGDRVTTGKAEVELPTRTQVSCDGEP